MPFTIPKTLTLAALSIALNATSGGAEPPKAALKEGASIRGVIQPGDRTTGRIENTLLLAEGGKALQRIVIAPTASKDDIITVIARLPSGVLRARDGL